MPFLSVSDQTLDPDFATTFNVVRRAQTVDANGWNQPGATMFNNVIGIIVPASPNDLRRLPENQRLEKTIKVVTRFALRGPSKAGGSTYEPDLVQFAGNYYVPVSLEDLTRFGGQIEAVCQMTDYTPAAPGTA